MSDVLRARLLAAYADELRDHVAALRAVLATGGGDIEDAYRHAHSLKGAARAVDLPGVVELAHRLESLLEAWWESGVVPDAATLEQARLSVDGIEDQSAGALAGQPPTADEVAEPLTATLRVEAETLDDLAVSMARMLAELERRRTDVHNVRKAAAGGHLDDALRGLEEADWTLSRAVEAVAGDVARLRLVAADATLGNFGPMLRALATEMGKTVRYDTQGLETLADRDVLTTVAEAVMHLLRNAVAHGIEPPFRRRDAGKDPVGRLLLTVAASGPRLEIHVCDDGAGIPVARLTEAAVARGLLTPEQAASAGEDRLRQLVFHPGLSTADTVSTAAGRGMGMAIVRRLVERLQGQVEVHARPGGGTEVILRVPVSAMVQRIVLVRAAHRLFGLPASAVVRLTDQAASKLVMVEGRLMAVVEGGELPVLPLAGLLDLPVADRRQDEGLRLVVLRAAVGTMALTVDEVADVRDLWVSPLDPSLVEDSRLAGTVTLEGGALALVLAPAGLGGTDGVAPAMMAGARRVPLILVVDDSPAIRTLERTLLEANSYQVEVAVDGLDALEAMRRRRPDLVVSDVEMPRRDGFGLLAAMRADPDLDRVPVVLLSSRSADADREAGLSAGAAAYLVKTSFDQREFLDIIGRLTA